MNLLRSLPLALLLVGCAYSGPADTPRVTTAEAPDPACSVAARCPDPTTIDESPVTLAINMFSPDPNVPDQPYDPADPNPAGGNGQETVGDHTPWMAEIERPRLMPKLTARELGWDDRMYCGGALIAPGWILTAAHCLYDNGSDILAQNYRVRLGMHSLSGSDGASYRITAIYPHPDYDPVGGYYSDIALIRFASDSQTATARPSRIQAIMLAPEPRDPAILEGLAGYFYGWGRTEEDHIPDGLRYFKVSILADTECSRSAIAICARGLGERPATQCHGDSGGPLVVFNGAIPVLAGVVSHNTEKAACGQQKAPGVFTRVPAFRAWIEGIIGKKALEDGLILE